MPAARALFAAHGLRCTPQRLAIYEALCRHGNHPTAEELYRQVGAQAPRLSLATVYNTLEALCRAGLARKLPTHNGTCRYDADTSQHLHIWFRDSDQIHDVPTELGQRMIAHVRRAVAEIEAKLGVEIDGLNIELLARRHLETVAATG
jgi:Fe2+ or Zn2+ uptake regulation protein